MRNKIDYGIDLGTTNSSIARMENGKPIIKKSDTLKDTTPSCISITKKGDFLAGDIAFNVLKNDSTRALKDLSKNGSNSFLEFKRTMGTTHLYESTYLGSKLSSEELSAEVLKKLKSYIVDENVTSVVITVPAKFLNPQKDATMKAARLAGFKHVELLQEPVAAATAYGLNSKKKDGYWIVFDFGGGTFDAALVKAEEGILSVKDTAGDNWLGGKNLDNAIVDQLLLPYLKDNYAIEFLLNDEVKLQMLREALKPYAEEVKNQLSFKETYNVLTNLGDLPFEDENGEEPEIDLDISQADLEKVIAPIFQKAIDITKELLNKNNLKGKDLDALILVGGPTYSPILRRMLKERVSENVDTSIDPMTAVAVGAALFASTISVNEGVKDENRDKTKLQLEINYEATTVEFDDMINIQVLKEKTIGKIPEDIYVELVRGDGAWSSGKKKVSTEKKTLFEVLLVEGSNQFQVVTYDDQGNRIPCQPDSFNMLQGIGGLDSMTVLPYNIGIAKYYDEFEADKFLSVKGLEQNQRVPATGVRNGLKTRQAIRPGMAKDIIRIPIYQGEHNADGTNPLLNNWVYDVIITGESVPRLLPEGSDVDITIKLDRSEKMFFSAYFPIIDHTEELEIDIKNAEPPTATFLKQEIAKAKKTANSINNNSLYSSLVNLENEIGNSGLSADGRLQIIANLRKELLKLEELEKSATWPNVEKNLKDAFFSFEDLVRTIKANNDVENLNMNLIEAHLAEFKNQIDQVIRQKDIKTAKNLTEEIEMLDREIRNELSDGALDVRRIQYHHREFDQLKWKDRIKARQLVNQGLKMISDGQTKQLRPVILQIWDLRIDPEDEIEKETLR
jgi:molecular chaperone DnaK